MANLKLQVKNQLSIQMIKRCTLITKMKQMTWMTSWQRNEILKTGNSGNNNPVI